MYFHILLTERCNSQCRYCYKKSQREFGEKLKERFEFDFSAPADFSVDVLALKRFFSKDKNPKIIFYGGEPLLKIEKMKQIMDEIPAEFFMQTNGKHLCDLPAEYMNRFKRILVSIDGDKERTDFNRGKRTYDSVLENLKKIRKDGFKGEVVARMTISFSDGFTDLIKQIKHLFSIGFDSVHWQLDMGFYESDYDEKQVENFVENYNKEISKLINWWVEEMKAGEVLKIYPLLGIFESWYYGKKEKLRCGSGHAGYTITTDGKIVTCPIMNCIKDFYVGDISSSEPNNLKEISIIEPCVSCELLNICGGRCLYSNRAKLWPEKGEEQICSTIKYLIEEIKNKIPTIKRLIEKGVVKKKDFEYERYFGPEIIP